jgi:hypothetical protein
MKRVLLLLSIISLLVTPGCGLGESGTEAASACSGIICPPGTTRDQTSSATSSCSGGGSVDVLTRSGSVSGQCFGSGECAIICHPPKECCGGEEWTTISYKCDLPCAGACSCDGRCGPVAGTDCDVDCGDCTGTDVCSPDGYCEASCGESETLCGEDCCDVGELCHQNLCCDRVYNCEGKQCGDDGCGSLCEDQDSIAGCAADEECIGGTCTSGGCVGIASQCASEGAKEFINGCVQDDDGNYAWGVETDCSSLEGKPHCDEGPTGPECVMCSQDDHCGDTTFWGCSESVCVCTPNCVESSCGKDGCGGSCGSCGDSLAPNCLDPEDDGSFDCYACQTAEECGNGDPDYWSCSDGVCACDKVLDPCAEKSCGENPCGGWCGDCEGDGCDSVGEKACSTVELGAPTALTCAAVGGELMWQTLDICAGETPVCDQGACVCTSDATCTAPGEECIGGACTYVAGCGNGVVDPGELCLGAPQLEETLPRIAGIQLMDLNEDNVLDIVFSTVGIGFGDGFLQVKLGDGAGGFSSAQQIDLEEGSIESFHVSTFTGTTVDVLVQSTYDGWGYLDLYTGANDGTFSYKNGPYLGANTKARVGVGRLDAGGTTDIVFHDALNGETGVDVRVALGDKSGAGLIDLVTKQTQVPPPYKFVRDIEIGDLDGDGGRDMVMVAGTLNFGFGGSGDCNDATTYAEKVLTYRSFKSNPLGAAKTFTLDGTVVSVATSANPADYPSIVCNGVASYARLKDLELFDFDGDNDLDFVVTTGTRLSVYQNTGGSFTPLWASAKKGLDLDPGVNSNPMKTQAVEVGDLDGDGTPDLVAAVKQMTSGGSQGGYAAVFLGDGLEGSWTLEDKSLLDVGYGVEQLALGDLNGDKALDVVFSAFYVDKQNGNAYIGKLFVSLQAP